MIEKILGMLGVTLIHYHDRQSVSLRFAEARFQRNLSGIHDLLKICGPGTNMEVMLDDAYGQTLSMKYRLEGDRRDELKLKKRDAA